MRHLTFLLCLFLGFTSMAHAIMPPKVYAERSQNSKVKAIAVIIDVQLDESTGENTVLFRNEYALTNNTPPTFTAYCYSAVTEKQKNMVGGTVYFYPEKGERVYVTVSSLNGSITSLTLLTPELESAIRQTPERIKYGISNAYIDPK